jgi:TRAP-type transport system periplasmic protein
MKLNRRRFLATSSAVAGSALFAPNLALAQNRSFRLGIATPPGHSWNDAALAAGEMMAQASDGRIELTVFHASQLGTEAAMLQQLQSGALDFAWLQTAELGTRVPQIAAINAPYLVQSTEQIPSLIRHPVAQQLLDLLPEETGTIGLGWGITGMRSVFSSRPVETVADLQGLKLRTHTTPAFRDFYELLGAAPTPLPTPQVYDAMANGQVDGLEADLEFSWNQRFDQVSQSMLRMDALFMPVVALVSGRVWQGLTEADREIIDTAVKTALDAQIDSLVSNEPELIANFEGSGIAISSVTATDVDELVALYDAKWNELAPNLPDLRSVSAQL